MIRPFAYLVPLYAAAVAAKSAAYDRGWTTPQRLAWPVVSVGNLSVGGAGKTPLVIRLAQLLASENIPVDVLSRGYGRRDESLVERVALEGDAERYGDEPLLIARATGIPVYVGASRYEAGLLAERHSSHPGIHLLDDGFQHRKLARALDVVVVHATDFEETLLPAGRLREPLAALGRASVIVLRAEDRGREPELRSRGITAPVWIQHRRLAVSGVANAVAFCGIARPDEFFSALHSQNVELAAAIALRDHHRYTNADLARLVATLRQHSAQCFVTTEKDAARLTREQRAHLEEVAPVHIARLQVSLEDESAVLSRLWALLVRK
ncbi:MAG: tetraacyldisaccharide 4'-kinase [Acidobacteriaceae bacterium]